MPESSEFVFSDTFGLVSSRNGKAVITSATRKFNSFFELLCRYLDEHLPDNLRHFGFSSISLNFDYAAALHRDSNNIGPSIATSVGQFIGGDLRYWKDDDGALPLDALTQNYRPTTVETHNRIVLFDALRAHEVTPFEGRRYSVIYYTHNCIRRADTAVLESLPKRPDEALLQNQREMLCPPRGYDLKYKTQTIAECLFGKSDKPCAEAWASYKSISNLQDDTLQASLSFFLTIGNARVIGAVDKRFSSMLMRPGSWAGTIVDSTNVVPAGARAQKMWTAWTQTRYVVTGNWALTHVSLRLSRKFWVWLWRMNADGSPYFTFPGGVIMIGNQPSKSFSCEFVLDRIPSGRFAVGLTNSPEPVSIATAIGGQGEFGTILAYIGEGYGFRYNNTRLGGKGPPKKWFSQGEVHVDFRKRREGDRTVMELRLNSALASSCEAGVNIEGTLYPIAIFKNRPRGDLRPCFS